MKRFSKYIAAMALVVGFVGLSVVPSSVGAVNVYDACSSSTNADSAVCKSSGDKVDSILQTIINVTIYLIGIVSVIMIISGGYLYTTSSGNEAQVTKAKNTVTYAIVGLLVAISAYAIVNWVIFNVNSPKLNTATLCNDAGGRWVPGTADVDAYCVGP